MKNAEKFLKERNILNGNEQFPINLSRDTHIKTKNEIIKAMNDYAELTFKNTKEAAILACYRDKTIDSAIRNLKFEDI